MPTLQVWRGGWHLQNPPTLWGQQACGIVVWCLPPPVVLPLGSSMGPLVVTNASPPWYFVRLLPVSTRSRI